MRGNTVLTWVGASRKVGVWRVWEAAPYEGLEVLLAIEAAELQRNFFSVPQANEMNIRILPFQLQHHL